MLPERSKKGAAYDDEAPLNGRKLMPEKLLK